MKKYIVIIFIFIILMISILFIFNYFINKKHKKEIEKYEKVIEDTNKYLEQTKKEYEDLKKIKIKSVKEFIYLKDEEKNEEYEKLYNINKEKDKIIEQNLKTINNLNKNLKDCKNNYKRLANRKGITIEPFVLVGIKYKDINDINVSSGIGVVISKTFDLKLFTFGIGGGGYGKIPTDDEKEFGGVLQVKIGW